jgi:hypothetical protein
MDWILDICFDKTHINAHISKFYLLVWWFMFDIIFLLAYIDNFVRDMSPLRVRVPRYFNPQWLFCICPLLKANNNCFWDTITFTTVTAKTPIKLYLILVFYLWYTFWYKNSFKNCMMSFSPFITFHLDESFLMGWRDYTLYDVNAACPLWAKIKCFFYHDDAPTYRPRLDSSSSFSLHVITLHYITNIHWWFSRFSTIPKY